MLGILIVVMWKSMHLILKYWRSIIRRWKLLKKKLRNFRLRCSMLHKWRRRRRRKNKLKKSGTGWKLLELSPHSLWSALELTKFCLENEFDFYDILINKLVFVLFHWLNKSIFESGSICNYQSVTYLKLFYFSFILNVFLLLCKEVLEGATDRV